MDRIVVDQRFILLIRIAGDDSALELLHPYPQPGSASYIFRIIVLIEPGKPVAEVRRTRSDPGMLRRRIPEKRKPRMIRLVRSPSVDGVGVLSIKMGDQTAFYTIHEIPCEIGGRGFEVHLLGLGELYHVRVGEPNDCTCECKGFLFRNYCRHTLGLLALIREGKL